MPSFRLFSLLASLVAVWGPCLASAQPVDDRPARYEPYGVDKVYPLPPEAVEGDAGEATEGETPKAPETSAGTPTPAEATDGAEESPAGADESVPAPPSPSEDANQTPAKGDPAPPTTLDEPAYGAGTASAPASSLPPVELPEESALDEPVMYGASGRAQRREAGRTELRLEDARDLPGSFGDPLRVVELMPGVVPVGSGLPYFYSRGSPPANQGYRFDGLQLPQLFHLAIGPQVLHPRMFGDMEYYGAVAPTNFGRRAGALLDIDGAPHRYELSGELDLRLLDVNGFVEAPALGGNLQVAGRYGYPGLGLKLFSSDSSLVYWDGQLRYELPLDRRNRLQLVWVGSYDDGTGLPLGSGPIETRAIYLHFHRVALRLLHETDTGGELGVSLRFGYEDADLGTALASTAVTFGPKLFFTQPFGTGHQLSLGADMLGSTGQVDDQGGTLASIDGQLQIDLPTIGDAAARNQGGAYAEMLLQTSELTRLRTGVRVDLWHVQDVLMVGVDPRLRFSVQAHPNTQLHVAAGMAHQPAVFLLPLPGLADVALADRLTRSYQLEAGVQQDLPYDIELSVTPFFTYQQNLLLPELIPDGRIGEDAPLVDARTGGIEAFAQGNVLNRLRFMASYTLAYAKAFSPPQVIGAFRPDFDVRHVLNLSARYDFPRGFNAGLRLSTRSGRMIEQQNPAYAQRLPWFTRLDVRLGYGWLGRWAEMEAYFEFLNAALQGEYLDADCFFGQCVAERAPPVAFANIGVRASFDGHNLRPGG